MARNSSIYGKNIRLTLSKTLIKQYIAEIAVPTCMSYYDHIAQLLLYISWGYLTLSAKASYTVPLFILTYTTYTIFNKMI